MEWRSAGHSALCIEERTDATLAGSVAAEVGRRTEKRFPNFPAIAMCWSSAEGLEEALEVVQREGRVRTWHQRARSHNEVAEEECWS